MTLQVWGMTPQESHIKTTRAIICVSVGCRACCAVVLYCRRPREIPSYTAFSLGRYIFPTISAPPSIECELPLHCLQLCRFKRD